MFPSGNGGKEDSQITTVRPELAAVAIEEWEGCQGIKRELTWEQEVKVKILNNHFMSQNQAGLDIDFISLCCN